MVICRKCKHSKHRVAEYYSCRATVRNVDAVTGKKKYADCVDVNRNGECKLYKASLKTEFIDDMKSLFQKIIDYFDLNKGWYGKKEK